MPGERSDQRSASATPRFTSPSPSGFATPSSSSRAPNPPVSLLSRAHRVLQAAREPRGSSAVAHGASPRDRMRRGFSLFKDDLLHRQPGDHQHSHGPEEGEVLGHEVVLSEDRPGGVAYKDTADLESADTWIEHDREDQGGTADKDVKMYLRRKRRLKSSKGMYVASPLLLVLGLDGQGLMLGEKAWGWLTIFRSSTGCANTNGLTCKEISVRL